MTKQFDLAFNTTNTMENLMNSSKFSTKEYKSDAGFETKFSNYLDDANKHLKSNESNSNVSKNNKESLNSDKNYKSKENVSYSENKNAAENKTTTEYYDEKESSNENLNLKDEITESKKDVISGADDLQLSDVTEELNEQDMDELLKDSMLNAALSNSQIMSGDKNVKLESEIVQEPVKFLADSIKGGILFDDNTGNTEDLSNVDIKAVDEVIEDISVSKDEYISAMYANKKDVNLKNEQAPVLKTELDAENIGDIKSDEKVEENKISLLKSKNDNSSELLDNKNVSSEVSEDNNNVQLTESKSEVKTNSKILEESKNVDENETNVKNINSNMISETVTEKDVNIVLQPEVKEQVDSAKLTTGTKSETVKDEIVYDKNEKLNDEITSAKLENSANIAAKTEKTVPDENAKTNVDTDETMDIKEDVDGIEFKSQPKVETSDEKNVLDNKVAQKVENVKIQVEENLKVSNVQQNSTDAAKIAKANETLEQAGLSTENLKKIDGKIKDVDYSSNQNSQTDLGQSSQEMMFREMIQNSSENSSQSPLLSKIDFSQTLQKAHVNLNQNQPQQDVPDIDILEQIRTRLNVSNKGGMQKITIGLTPESLGKLNIEISRGQNGISAQILADNPQAKEILEKNLDGLKSVLQSQGVNVNNVNVKVAETNRSSDSDNNMFQNEDSAFNSNNKEGNSKNSDDSGREKHSEFEFIQNTVLSKESSDDVEDTMTRTSQLEKTVSIKGGLGKVNYKM